MSHWSLYLVRNRNNQLYTGITTDVERRFAEHQSGGPKAARALRGKGPLSLVFHIEIGDRRRALKMEYRVKQLSKAQKESLVAGMPVKQLLPDEALDKEDEKTL